MNPKYSLDHILWLPCVCNYSIFLQLLWPNVLKDYIGLYKIQHIKFALGSILISIKDCLPCVKIPVTPIWVPRTKETSSEQLTFFVFRTLSFNTNNTIA